VRDLSFLRVRQRLLRECSTLRVLELGSGAFPDAQVEAFVVIAKKKRISERGRAVTLSLATADGRITSAMEISRPEASIRWDFSYHAAMKQMGAAKLQGPTLANLGAKIVRGSRTRAQFVFAGQAHIHTSAFDSGTTRMRLSQRGWHSGLTVAESGDVLIPRVGTRCLLRQAVVESGFSPITEAVYRIRIPDKYRDQVLNALEAPVGQLWRFTHARGSCARHLAVGDILSMPISAT